jgi:hypothetical protein
MVPAMELAEEFHSSSRETLSKARLPRVAGLGKRAVALAAVEARRPEVRHTGPANTEDTGKLHDHMHSTVLHHSDSQIQRRSRGNTRPLMIMTSS